MVFSCLAGPVGDDDARQQNTELDLIEPRAACLAHDRDLLGGVGDRDVIGVQVALRPTGAHEQRRTGCVDRFGQDIQLLDSVSRSTVAASLASTTGWRKSLSSTFVPKRSRDVSAASDTIAGSGAIWAVKVIGDQQS
jgi:hypothetical protein